MISNMFIKLKLSIKVYFLQLSVTMVTLRIEHIYPKLSLSCICIRNIDNDRIGSCHFSKQNRR